MARGLSHVVVGGALLLALTACSAAGARESGALLSGPPSAASTATAGPAAADPTAGADPTPLLEGYRVVRTVRVPGDGPAAYADGLVWAVDPRDRGMDAQGRVNGDVYGVDPASGRIVAHVRHARGGFPAAGLGSLWLINAEFGETVTRIRLDTRAVSRFRTSSTEDPAPEAVVTAAGFVWVGNNHDGTVVKVDPDTEKVVATVVVSSPSAGGVRGHAAAGGDDVWMPSDSDHSIARIDARTASIVSRIVVPVVPHPDAAGHDPAELSAPEWMEVVDGRLWVSTVGHVYVYDVSRVGAEQVVADIPTEGRAAVALAVGDGAVWAVTPDPCVLLRIDSTSYRVTGRLPLRSITPRPGLVPLPVVAGGSTWVRTEGELLEIGPAAA